MTTPRKATLTDAVERLAAREADGADADHELESERERMLGESEGEEVAVRARLERAYRTGDYMATHKGQLWAGLLALCAVGAALLALAWLTGGFPH